MSFNFSFLEKLESADLGRSYHLSVIASQSHA